MWLLAAAAASNTSTWDFWTVLGQIGVGGLVLVAFVWGLKWNSSRADQRENNLQQEVDQLRAEVARLQEERIRDVTNNLDRERALATSLGTALPQSAATLRAAVDKLEANRSVSFSDSEVARLRAAVEKLTRRLDQ